MNCIYNLNIGLTGKIPLTDIIANHIRNLVFALFFDVANLVLILQIELEKLRGKNELPHVLCPEI